jgi:hypothetical protein
VKETTRKPRHRWEVNIKIDFQDVEWQTWDGLSWIKIGTGAETWTLRKVDQKYLVVLKWGVGEGWRTSVGPIVWEMKKYYIGSRRRGIFYMHYKRRKANWIGHTFHRDCGLKRIEEKIEGKNRRDGKTRKKT